jgi:hypothetical protein
VAAGAPIRPAAAGTNSGIGDDVHIHLKERTMNIPEWLRPDLIFGTILYAVIGVVVLWIAFILIDKLTPYHLWHQLVEEKNVALAIVVGALFIALGMIIAAAIHG